MTQDEVVDTSSFIESVSSFANYELFFLQLKVHEESHHLSTSREDFINVSAVKTLDHPCIF
jgi:hypothetical protein